MQGEALPQVSKEQQTGALPEDAPHLAEWVESELGDRELAEFLRTHSSEVALLPSGERALPRTAFDLLDDLDAHDAPAFLSVARAMVRGEIFPQLTHQHVVGNAPAEKIEAVEIYQKRKSARSVLAFEDNERKRTPEDEVLVHAALTHLNTLRASAGLKEIPPPRDALHLIDQAWIAERTVGTYTPFEESIKVGTWKSPVQQLSAITHELAHLASYASLQVAHDEEEKVTKFACYRLGLVVGERNAFLEDEKSYLVNINEAVTEEVARRFVMGIREDDPQLGHIAIRRNRNIQQFFDQYAVEAQERGEIPEEIVDLEERADGALRPHHFLYLDERKLMYALFNKMYVKNPQYFEGRTSEDANEELFGMLQKAMFTGNILPFGRLFNDTFGSGKFREFGHLQTTKAQVEFIGAL